MSYDVVALVTHAPDDRAIVNALRDVDPELWLHWHGDTNLLQIRNEDGPLPATIEPGQRVEHPDDVAAEKVRWPLVLTGQALAIGAAVHPHQALSAHEPGDAVVPHPQPVDLAQVGLDPGGTVGAPRPLVVMADPLGQCGVGAPTRAGAVLGPANVLVVALP